MKALLILTFGALLLGCEARDRDTIAKETGKAWEHASQAAATAWASVAKQASEITPDSPDAVIAAAKRAAESAREQLAKIPDPTPEVKKQQEAVRAALAKLAAALRLRDLQDQAAAMVASAQKQAENAGKSAEDVRKHLEGASQAYQNLQRQIEEARARYEQTAAEVQRRL